MSRAKILSSASLAVLFACGSDIDVGPDRQQSGQARPTSFGEAQEATAGLAPDEVIGVLLATSRATTDINALARARGRDPLVIAFAERNSALQPHDQRFLEMALARLGISPVESIQSDRVRQRAQQIMAMLQAQGIDFDTAFVESQIAVQREMIRVMDESNVCSRIPVAGCSGFGSSSFVGGLRDFPVPLAFDEQSLFTRLRSTMVADLTDASILGTLITPSQP